MRERITVEPLGEASTVTVRLRGRMTGVGHVLQILGFSDTAKARGLADEASLRADFRVREITNQFGRVDKTD